MAEKPRNFRKEYDSFQGKPEQIANRASRNAARREMEKKHGKAALAGKDVGHADGNPRNNDPKNLKIESPSKNRARKK